MSNELQVFSSTEFGEVRTAMIDGKAWFVGKDVAQILGYNEPHKAISRHIDEDDGMKHPVTDSLGRTQEAVFINESGLYSLILSSKLPTAKKFKRWVTSEVLPTLRKTGTYSVLTKPDSYMIEDPVERAKRWIEEYNEKKLLTAQIEEQKPMVEFASQVSDTTSLVDIGAFAKMCNKQGMKIGRNKLFEWLRDKGFLRWNNEPYQRFVNEGYFVVKEYTYQMNGNPMVNTKTYLTGKGQQYIFKKLMA